MFVLFVPFNSFHHIQFEHLNLLFNLQSVWSKCWSSSNLCWREEFGWSCTRWWLQCVYLCLWSNRLWQNIHHARWCDSVVVTLSSIEWNDDFGLSILFFDRHPPQVPKKCLVSINVQFKPCLMECSLCHHNSNSRFFSCWLLLMNWWQVGAVDDDISAD